MSESTTEQANRLNRLADNRSELTEETIDALLAGAAALRAQQKPAPKPELLRLSNSLLTLGTLTKLEERERAAEILRSLHEIIAEQRADEIKCIDLSHLCAHLGLDREGSP